MGAVHRRNISQTIRFFLPLKYYGTDHLDYVIITHTDEDHISGIRELLEEEYPVKILFFRIR
ncbi:MAG: MBL fold metallo-hydrolase [Anaerobutyricum soehngenii]